MQIQSTEVFSTDEDERIPTRDFSLTDQFTDAVLLVEGKKFHVFKAALGWNNQEKQSDDQATPEVSASKKDKEDAVKEQEIKLQKQQAELDEEAEKMRQLYK